MFEDKKRNVWVVIDSITSEVSSWMLTKSDFKGYFLNDLARDWITCISGHSGRSNHIILDLVPLSEGKLKVNFDDAMVGMASMQSEEGEWCEPIEREYYKFIDKVFENVWCVDVDKKRVVEVSLVVVPGLVLVLIRLMLDCLLSLLSCARILVRCSIIRMTAH